MNEYWVKDRAGHPGRIRFVRCRSWRSCGRDLQLARAARSGRAVARGSGAERLSTACGSVPNLVGTVKGAANFEQQTLTAVTEARAKVGQVTSGALENIARDPQAFQRFEQAQAGLSSALSRLMVVAERYPELKATQNFRDLQAQLEGTENRISVERMRFNEASQAFNTRRNTFPTVIVASLFGDRFQTKLYFQAQAGAEKAPEVKF